MARDIAIIVPASTSLYHPSSEMGKCTISGTSNPSPISNHFNKSSYQALGLAVLGIALTVQAFVSTALDAAEVLVWMPLTLVLDVGAMLQMVILIIEKYDTRWREWAKLEDSEEPEPPRGLRVLWDAVKNLMQDIRRMLSRKLLGNQRRGDEEAQNGT